MRKDAACENQWSVEEFRKEIDRVSFVTPKGSRQTLALLRGDSTYNECVYRASRCYTFHMPRRFMQREKA